ncbi:MAG: superoxide dismutase, partial [Hyphomonadaceae bacterium]
MFVLPDLPYDKNALDPVISSRTLGFHYGKHHAAYVKKTNELAKEKGLEQAALEEIIRAAGEGPLFNNAAQAWNHAFYWLSMKPAAARAEPSADLKAALDAIDGGFRAHFLEQGASHFASGWIWLVADAQGALSLRTTKNAGTPLTDAGLQPILVCDLWEHAYYLDHQNDRKAYLEGWLDRLAAWGFAGECYAAALRGEPSWRHPPP